MTLANETMAEALRLISIQKGFDPKAFTLCCFGGAGGLHLCELAERAGDASNAWCPLTRAIFSALGMLAATPGRELTRARQSDRAKDCDPAGHPGSASIRCYGKHARSALAAEGVDDTTVHPVFELRYQGQTQTLSVPYLFDLQAAFTDFEVQHQNRYGHQLNTGLELVALRVRVAGIPRLKTAIIPKPSTEGPVQAPQTTPNTTPHRLGKTSSQTKLILAR